jgi:hypothetical protein
MRKNWSMNFVELEKLKPRNKKNPRRKSNEEDQQMKEKIVEKENYCFS